MSASNPRGTMIDPEYDRRFIMFTDEQLKALGDLYKAGWSTRKLGRRYGISPTTVQRRLKAMGVELRDLGLNHIVTDHVMTTAHRMRREGARWKAIAAATGVNHKSIWSAMKRERIQAGE